MKFSIYFIAIIALFSCAAQQKEPEKKWEVKVTKESDQKVWIWKYDGSKQCDAPSTFTPKVASIQCKEAGIRVHQFRNGSDGMMYPSVCGAATGFTVELEISKIDLPKAQQMGFKVKQN